MYQNHLIRGYQGYLNQPVQFMNNQMFNNNPIYASNIHDKNFYQRMMLQKEEQMKKIRNVSDLGLTKEQIAEYVIAPIKLEKSDKSQIEKLCNDEKIMLTEKFIKENWWENRLNLGYKNIIKNHNTVWNKKRESGDDLIVHKVTSQDKVGLLEEYEKILQLIKEHEGELKLVYSASKQNEHKKNFKFVQKTKYRMKYDPKDYNDLKDYYKKEQKKHENEQKRIDDVISRLMDDKMDSKELKEIESELLQPSNSNKKNKSKNKDNIKEKNKEKNIDIELQALIDECGEDVLKDLENSDIENYSNKNKQIHRSSKYIQKSKTKSRSSRSSFDSVTNISKIKNKDRDRDLDRTLDRTRDRDSDRTRDRDSDRKRINDQVTKPLTVPVPESYQDNKRNNESKKPGIKIRIIHNDTNESKKNIITNNSPKVTTNEKKNTNEQTNTNVNRIRIKKITSLDNSIEKIRSNSKDKNIKRIRITKKTIIN